MLWHAESLTYPAARIGVEPEMDTASAVQRHDATRVDIVIDNYNYGRYLHDAIDSALAQTVADVTVIVVDDGSTDESRDVIAQYGSSITAVLKSNGGQASAFNAGFAASTGDVVIFLDADDLLIAHTAQRVLQQFRQQPDLAKVQYRMAVVDQSGVPTGVVKPPSHLQMPQGDVARQELAQPFDLTWMATSGNAFPAWVLRRLLPMPEAEYRAGADFYLQHLPPLLGPVFSAEWIGAEYRVHGGNSYERADHRLDLHHVRQSVTYAAITRRELIRVATEVGLAPPREILSVADLANRMASRKLEPALHPLADDRIGRIALQGLRAAGRRAGEGLVIRILFAVWFLAMFASPRRLARRLAELFIIPERRMPFNRWLARRRSRTTP